MADAFANLPKEERIEKALEALEKDSRLTLRRAGLIYNICHTTLSRRQRELSKSRKLVNQQQQLLTPVEERTLVKFVVQYYKWGLPLNLNQLKSFAAEILRRKRPYSQGSEPYVGEHWHKRFIARNP
jgi:helix-turn-helix, Psq domain/Tc5 transposase DNA-binding domain